MQLDETAFIASLKGYLMVSIKDVARLAKVSPATVSRVINKTSYVAEDKKARVLKVIDETGFMPNNVARSLFKGSSKIIGMIVPDIINPFFSELAKNVERFTYQNGYQLVVCSSNDELSKELASIKTLMQLNADGLILISSNQSLQKELVKSTLPIVLVDRYIDTKEKKVAYIQANHYQGGKLATKHLYDCGCRHIINLRGPDEYSSARQRYRGYLDTCKEYGLKAFSIEAGYNYESGLKASEKILELYPEVDGIVASDDIVAMAIMKVLDSKGIAIPEDVQLIGYDNVWISKLATKGITTIAQPIVSLAENAVQLLVNSELYDGEKQLILDVKLIQRETTKGE